MSETEQIPTILQEIAVARAQRIEQNRRQTPLGVLRQLAENQPPARDFARSLARGDTGRVALIAEYKRRSPSRGNIRLDLGCRDVVAAYERGGASAVSILTEPDFFGGDDTFIGVAREATGLPILRKDFIIDEYQVYESRVLGADAVLLIVALLDDSQLRGLLQLTRDLGMQALVEVHTSAELERALRVGATVVGVNNRDLHTFETRLAVTEDLAPLVGSHGLTVSESGIKTVADVRRVARAGAQAILVGETLMRSTVIERAVGDLLQPHAPVARRSAVFTKICGISTREALEAAVGGGADAVGFVFAPSSRRVTVDQAAELAAFARQRTPEVLKVGVFVDAVMDFVGQVADRVGLDVVQLHGNESPGYCRAVRAGRELQVWKALRMGGDAGAVAERLSAYDDAGVDGYVLDTNVPGQAGGTGKIYDWSLVRPLRERTGRLLLVAGGLNAANAGEALERSGADGLDVSSGVEVDRRKSPQLITEFLARARGTTVSS